MSEKCCLITGGKGFMGSHLVDALINEGWRVKVLDRSNGPENSHAEYFIGSFGDRTLLRTILPGVDVLLHFASTTTPAMAFGRSAFDVESNLIGTLSLLEECLQNGVNSVIFPSSGGTVYGKVLKIPTTERHPTRPISSHGIIKIAIENYIQMLSYEKGLDYTILRIANPYGPRQRPDALQGAVAVFAGKLLRNETIELWGSGNVVRDFIYIEDVVNAVLSALHSKKARNQVINVGSGEGISIRDLLAMIETATGKSARVSWKLARNFDVPANVLSIKKASSKLNWKPNVSLEMGIHKTIPWIKDYLARRG